MEGLVEYFIGIVVVLAVVAGLWSTIDGFVQTLVNAGGSAGDLAGLIELFLILALVLAIIYGALQQAKKGKK